MLQNICIEKYSKLEKERNKVMAMPEFQNWMKELRVSSLYEDRSCKIKANDLQSQYNVKLYSKLNLGV